MKFKVDQSHAMYNISAGLFFRAVILPHCAMKLSAVDEQFTHVSYSAQYIPNAWIVSVNALELSASGERYIGNSQSTRKTSYFRNISIHRAMEQVQA